ncbi:bud neck involved protein [Didymosphaeria variabile]|uniref:Bud neck involved protein n=1 Tax=Didymosphaeria variabile TaxID=1932322 RepID=A0A9W9CFY9_9PLEO|nr:bud neck involved protein [Didymosphaeria variabile]KAJ4360154.1 bud neck involved protein [Didymosphaeria variabile]
MPRSQSYAQAAGAGYRGTSAPIAPYAFSSTPQLRQDTRSTSGQHQQALPQQTQAANPARLGHPTHASSSSDSTVSTSGSSSRSLAAPSFTTREDGDFRKSVIDNLPASIGLSASVPDLSLSLPDAPVKPSPGRYRRGASRTDSSNSATVTTPTQQSPSLGATVPPSNTRPSLGLQLNTTDLLPPARPGHNRASSVDDMHMPRGGTSEQAKRYRRRSLSSIEAMATTAAPLSAPVTAITTVATSKRPTLETPPASSSSRRPGSSQSHERQGSSGSTTSSHASTRPSSRHESTPSRAAVGTTSAPASKTPEPNRRIAPSPLSQPISPSEPSNPAPQTSSVSPAVKQLTALNDKDGSKGMKSRLRRAFSFGSAAELRRASAENNLSAERAKLRKDRYQNEEDSEQAAIIAKQEAAGIGAGIYNGQGGFTSSTDNISISSTASSASVMLRKMGHGMKKGTRSIKGLFRPKSVIGVPAADGPVMQPQVSRVTVEAERQKVNVNANPHEIGGGTGYPRLERNSIDAGRSTDTSSLGAPSSDSLSRKSIIGGDRERAEVLSSIKKGILKRTDTNSETSSPVSRPVDARTESPKSSAPSTPVNERNDYFTRPPRLANPSTRSLPNTPNGSRGNISFSPRLQFYDAWSASDYDRRGDIATCNRLTPMLAQQIKEELNSFKMEMEVHELSKPHTHFF